MTAAAFAAVYSTVGKLKRPHTCYNSATIAVASALSYTLRAVVCLVITSAAAGPDSFCQRVSLKCHLGQRQKRGGPHGSVLFSGGAGPT
jgi:hypothetical protein